MGSTEVAQCIIYSGKIYVQKISSTVPQVIYKISAEDGLHCSLQIRHLELDIVVAHDQTCGVASRYTGENVALLCDVATHANELNLFVAI